MAYGKKIKQSSILETIKFKIARILVSSFPLNAVRIWGLKLCGFKVGKNVYVGSGLIITMFNAKTKCDLEIGDRVAIAPRVTFVLASDANWSKLSQIVSPLEGKIVLKNDSWIGAGVIILPNVTVGKMSIIGAGSIVTKDVNKHTLVAGNPAKFIKKLKQESL